jgi:tetratricopeptide (TPR) repeat protein
MRLTLGLLCLAFANACRGTAPLPPKAAELNAAGIEALEAGDLETAGTRFALALEYSPRFTEALVNQGLVDLGRGNLVRARQLFERALRMNADLAQPHHALGTLEEKEGRQDRAADHYRDALKVDPGFAPSRANLARLYFESDKLDHAAVEYKKLVEVAPEELMGYVGLAECLLRLEREEEANALLEAAMPRFPEAPELELLGARALIRGGAYEQALALLARLVSRRDAFAVEALGWMATAELARGRARHAVGAAERALALDPRSELARYVMGLALTEVNPAAAVPWLERSLESAPHHPQLEAALERAREASNQ